MIQIGRWVIDNRQAHRAMWKLKTFALEAITEAQCNEEQVLVSRMVSGSAAMD